MANKTINLNEKMPAEEEIDNTIEATDSANLSSLDQPLNGGSDHSPPPPAENPPRDGPANDSDEAKSSVATASSHSGNDTVPVNDIDKKMRRAERFGVPVQLSEAEKRNSRAERFGTGSGLNKAEVAEKSEELKRKARAERFGISTTSVGTNEDEVKKKARLSRFASVSKADPEEEDKRKARAIRFSDPPVTSISQVNGKEAIAGKATEEP